MLPLYFQNLLSLFFFFLIINRVQNSERLLWIHPGLLFRPLGLIRLGFVLFWLSLWFLLLGLVLRLRAAGLFLLI